MLRESAGRLELPLNTRFYPAEIVGKAIKDFNKVCRISAEKRNTHIVVFFEALPAEELREVALEFANYALSLTRRARVQR